MKAKYWPWSCVKRGPAAELWSSDRIEIEIGVLRRQCLDRRIDDKEMIPRGRRLATAAQRRSAQIQWMFTTEKAREKLRKAYPVKES
jgi:hypothetical protein